MFVAVPVYCITAVSGVEAVLVIPFSKLCMLLFQGVPWFFAFFFKWCILFHPDVTEYFSPVPNAGKMLLVVSLRTGSHFLALVYLEAVALQKCQYIIAVLHLAQKMCSHQ